MPDPARARLEVPRDTYYLAAIRHFVHAVARRAGFSASVAAQIQMAVDEVCAAAATEGSDGGDHLAVTMTYDPRKLVVTVTDRGRRGATPGAHLLLADLGLDAPVTDVASMSHVITSTFMDEVELTDLPEGCEVRLVRYLRHPSSRLRRVDA